VVQIHREIEIIEGIEGIEGIERTRKIPSLRCPRPSTRKPIRRCRTAKGNVIYYISEILAEMNSD